jgi:hypothetical protein
MFIDPEKRMPAADTPSRTVPTARRVSMSSSTTNTVNPSRLRAMEHDAKQDAGNGDLTTTENIARGVDSAASSLGDLDRRLRPDEATIHLLVEVEVDAGLPPRASRASSG